jgi:hypothetical protein
MLSGEEHLLNSSTTGSSVNGVLIDSLSLALEEGLVIGLASERVLEGHLFDLFLLGVVISFLVIIKSFLLGLFGYSLSGIGLLSGFLNQGSLGFSGGGVINSGGNMGGIFGDNLGLNLLGRGLEVNLSFGYSDLLLNLLGRGLEVNLSFGYRFGVRVLELSELSHDVVSSIGLGSEDNGGDSEQKFHLELNNNNGI